MNTFEKYYQQFPKFLDKITKQQYDFIIPVAKKGAKLIKASKCLDKIQLTKVRYKSHFELFDVELINKKVAIIDDATQYTSTLLEYRRFFEKKGADVDTYSFVGHNSIYTGERDQYDVKANIEIFLSDPIYQEYILQQSYYLLENGNQFDLDHLVFQVNLDEVTVKKLITILREFGILIFIEDYYLKSKTHRFSLMDFKYFNNIPYFESNNIDMGCINKIKFLYRKDENKLYFSPLIFPTWNYNKNPKLDLDISQIPFKLPFYPMYKQQSDKSSIMNFYNLIQLIYAVSLTKSFFQEVIQKKMTLTNVLLRKDDFNAIYGLKITDELVPALKEFIFSKEHYNFYSPQKTVELKDSKNVKYHSFSKIFDKLRSAYESEVFKQGTRVGIHKYFSYDYIFPRFSDKLLLHENLDYFCDFGAIVPENYIEKGKVLRGIRTGEPQSEYSWKRTQVLLPMIVDYVASGIDNKDNGVNSMLYNKILANFAFDYSNTAYHELHCLIGQPYTFGTLTYVYHKLRAPNKFPIYHRMVSPHLKFMKNSTSFITADDKTYIAKINEYFDEQQEVGYSEIIQYLDLLIDIYKIFQKVDVLNMLSICRDEDCFYSHILYNIKTWFSDYGNYMDMKEGEEKLNCLHSSGTNVNSALNKLQLMNDSNEYYILIKKHFDKNIKYLKLVNKLLSNVSPITSNFRLILDDILMILKLQKILTNISLLKEYSSVDKYKTELEKLDFINFCGKNELLIPDNFLDDEEYLKIRSKFYKKITILVQSLPQEKPYLESKLTRDLQRKARNRAKSAILENELESIVIMYIDFTGFRNIPDPKEPIIGKYYRIVLDKINNRGGLLLYGANGGDDAIAVLMNDMRQSIECVKDIKNDFSQDIFLSKYDLKFGLSYSQLSLNNIDNDLINCWGDAKDCCEYKGVNFRNRGDLLISEKTYTHIKEKHDHLSQLFSLKTLDGNNISDKSRYLRFINISPIN